MKSKLLFGSAFVALCGLALPPVCQVAVGAETTFSEQAMSRLQAGLARTTLGTTIQAYGAAAGKADAHVLINDDASRDYSLPAGTTSFILSLSKVEVLNHFNFVNNDAEGKVTVSVSSTKLAVDAPGWRKTGGDETFDGHRVVDCDFGSAEGRYVKVDFETRKAGKIAGFGLYGVQITSNAPAKLNYVSTPTRTEVATQGADRNSFYDYASLSMGAKVVAISHADSLADAQYMIDGKPDTAFTFDAADPNPTAVIDLGLRRKVDRVTCEFSAPEGQLDFYLMDNAYSKDDSQPVALNYVTPPGVMPVANVETLNYNAGALLASHKPVGSIATTGGDTVNKVSVNLSGMQGRFLVAAFHRSGGHRRSGDPKDTVADAKDFKDKNVAIADNPVKVEGISAFGEPPSAQSIPLVPPDTVLRQQPVSP